MQLGILLGVVLLQLGVHSSNILIWNPTIGHSHVTFLGNIADVLTADGHNVTIFSSELDPHVKTFGNRLPARTIRYKPPKVDSSDWLKLEMKQMSLWETEPCVSVCIKWSDFNGIMEQMRKSCKELLDDNDTLNTLRESNFDLFYAETFDCCAPGIAQVLGIKSIVMTSALGMLPRLYEIAGVSPFPSFMPAMITPYSDDMTFAERLLNFKTEMDLAQNLREWDRKFGKVFSDKYPGFPGIRQIYDDKTALIMTNVNEFAETPRPTTNMIQYVGGATLYEPKPLNKELDDLLDQRPSTVLFSMGSLVQSKDMPAWLKRDIIDTFDSFPNVTFIWKYEGDDKTIFDSHPNIYARKWLPQTDLLADPRLTLFVTHGGMNSMLEAMILGKPMIVIPLFGDQQLNSKNIQKRGIGELIERHHLNRKTFTEALKKTLGNRELSRETAFVASMLKDRPKQYRESIARWARIIIEHGKMNHLVLQSKSMNFFQYYSLDVIGFLLALGSASLFISLWILKRLYSSIAIVKIKSN